MVRVAIPAASSGIPQTDAVAGSSSGFDDISPPPSRKGRKAREASDVKARKQVLSILRPLRDLPNELGAAPGASDVELLKVLESHERPLDALQRCGCSLVQGALVVELLPLAVAVPAPPVIGAKRRIYGPCICVLMALALAAIVILCTAAVWMFVASSAGFEKAECSISGFTNGTCRQRGGCALEVTVRADGRLLRVNAWRPTVQTDYYTGRSTYAGDALRCCTPRDSLDCCSLYDDSVQDFCDAWPPSKAPDGGSCSSGPWPCLFDEEFGKVKSLKPYETPVVWPFLAAAGVLMLLVACAAANIRWIQRRAQKKKAKEQHIRHGSTTSEDASPKPSMRTVLTASDASWNLSPSNTLSVASPTELSGAHGFIPGTAGSMGDSARAVEDSSRATQAAWPESAEHQTLEPPPFNRDSAKPLPTEASGMLKALANMLDDESSNASTQELKHPALRAADFTHLAASRKQHIAPPLHAQTSGPSIVMAASRTRSQRLQPGPGGQGHERRKRPAGAGAASCNHQGSREALRTRLADSLRQSALARDEPGDGSVMDN